METLNIQHPNQVQIRYMVTQHHSELCSLELFRKSQKFITNADGFSSVVLLIADTLEYTQLISKTSTKYSQILKLSGYIFFTHNDFLYNVRKFHKSIHTHLILRLYVPSIIRSFLES